MENKETPQWYVIHTYSGYEAMVENNLRNMVENNSLQDWIFEVKVPVEDDVVEKNGKRKVVQRKKFPSYVFIKMIYSNQVWYLVTNTRGVTGFVGPQGRPLPLKEEEVRKMQLETVLINADFAVGDSVSIDAGPLAGFIGQIKELNDSTQKAKVNVLMFGRNPDVEVDYVQIKKVITAQKSAAKESQEQG